MRIQNQITDEAFLQQIGKQLTQLRLVKNLTQGELAEQAGLGLRTVQRLESGEAATQLSSFIRVCRVLGLVDRLEALIPNQGVSPMAQLKLQGRERQRASGRKTTPHEPGKWQWGDAP